MSQKWAGGLGSDPDPAGGAYSDPPDLLDKYKGMGRKESNRETPARSMSTL